MSAGFLDDESGQFPGGEGVAGFFHAFLQGFQEHHIPDDDAEGMGGINAGGLRGSVSIHAPVRVRPWYSAASPGHTSFNPRTREGATISLPSSPGGKPFQSTHP